ncbi:MAG: hydantoinase/oxoprolinase family protein, partial [Candidatus Binatia bacterium]|nr:hydantoinase/oxoprolinase family protein [Candidatus Binatia bacterium]
RALLQAAGVEGAITCTRSADMRYLQQGFEIRVPLPPGRLTQQDLPVLRRAFAEEYQRLYKRLNPTVEIEAVSWRVVVSGPPPVIDMRPLPAAGESLADARKGERLVYFPEYGGFIPCAVYDRYRLPVGAVFSGPAVVEERECTVVVGPKAGVQIDEARNLVMTLL